MTSNTDIVNRALQLIGTRTTVSDAELVANSTNEAIQANLILPNIRRRLLRMAPWDCALKTANLTYITSQPGTPENISPGSGMWAPGIPSPPWAYEYQYPIDCLRACWIMPGQQARQGPNFSSAFSADFSVSNSGSFNDAGFGTGANFWIGLPARFKVQTDTFLPVTSVEVVTGGGAYELGDIITLPLGLVTDPPIGAPVQLVVTSVAAFGVLSTVGVVSQVPGNVPLGGSYFEKQINPISQASTSGNGAGATFNLTQGPPSPQRVILTNQEFATMVYARDVSDPNVTDDLFQDAWTKVLAATMNTVLQGDIKISNGLVSMANAAIVEARTVDGNEGYTVNDTTPDWIQARGINYSDFSSSPNLGFDWGALWAPFG